MNQKVRGIVFALSGVLLLLGALLYVVHLSVAPYLFAVGAAGITVCYMSVPVVGLDLRHKRLHRFNIIAGIFRFKPESFFELNEEEKAAAQNSPKISF